MRPSGAKKTGRPASGGRPPDSQTKADCGQRRGGDGVDTAERIADKPAKPATTKQQPSSTDEDAPKKGSDHEAAEPAAHKTVDERDEPTAAGVDTKKAVAKAEVNAAEDGVTKDAEVPAQTEEATAPPANEGGPVEEAVVESTTEQPLVATTFAVAATKTTITSPLTNVINAVGNLGLQRAGSGDQSGGRAAGSPAWQHGHGQSVHT
jgi:hypothetical protein